MGTIALAALYATGACESQQISRASLAKEVLCWDAGVNFSQHRYNSDCKEAEVSDQTSWLKLHTLLGMLVACQSCDLNPKRPGMPAA